MVSRGRRAYGCCSRAVETSILIAKIIIPGEAKVQSHSSAFGHAFRLALVIIIAVIAVWDQATFCSH